MSRYLSKKTTLMLLAAFFFVSSSFIQEAHAGIIWNVVSKPSPKPVSNGKVTTILRFSSSDARMGAYHIRLLYDRSLLKILSISVPETSEFKGNTFFNTQSFSSGKTDISGFQTTLRADQKRPRAFASVRWRILGPVNALATVKISARGLVDEIWRPIDVITYGAKFRIRNPDSDADGLPDSWEKEYFGNLDSDGAGDFDKDALSDLQEYLNGTDPSMADSDGDGMSDGWEVQNDSDPNEDDAGSDPDEDGYTNVDECHFTTDPRDYHSKPYPLAAFHSLYTDTPADSALLWWNASANRPLVYVDNSKPLAAQKGLTFNPSYTWRALSTLDAGGGIPAIAVLGVNAETGDVLVQVREALTGDLIQSLVFDKTYEPKALAMLPDMNGNSASEVAVLGVKSGTGDVEVHIKDASSGSSLKSILFEKTHTPKALAVIPDIDAGGAPGLAVLGVQPGTGEVVAQVKDAKTGMLLKRIAFDKTYAPKAFAVVPNVDGAGTSGLAVMGVKARTGEVLVQTKAIKTGTVVRDIAFNKAYAQRDFAVVPDINEKHDSALAVLGAKVVTGDWVIQLKNANSRVLIKNIPLPKGVHYKAMTVLPKSTENQSPRVCVLGVREDTAEIVLETRDMVGNSP